MTALGILAQEFAAVSSVGERDDLQLVADKLARNFTGAVVVLNGNGQLIGIISERELVNALSFRREAFDVLTARDIMKTDVVTCRPEQTELEVLIAMADKGIHHMPVTVGETVIGIVTLDETVKKRLRKVGHVTQQAALERDADRRLRMLDTHVANTVDLLKMARVLSTAQEEAGLGDLDLRARQIFMEIGDAERSGTPVLLRDLMRFHRFGGNAVVRKLVGQLEKTGLVELRMVSVGASPKRQHIVLTEAGRQLLDRMTVSMTKSLGS